MSDDTVQLTCVLLIANSDDRLTQAMWARYTAEMEAAVRGFGVNTIQCAYTNSASSYQSATYTFFVQAASRQAARDAIHAKFDRIRRAYRQSRIAMVLGDTEFITDSSS